MDHHTSPQFYLSQWGDRLCVMRRVHGGKIAHTYKGAKGTGYYPDLYKTEGVPEEDAHDLETKFMSRLDNDAATALQQLLSGIEPRDERFRRAWAMFICSLLYRNKEVVELLNSHMAALWSEGTRSLELMWQEQRTAGEKRTLAEATKAKLGDRAGQDAREMIKGIIDHDRAVPDIMRMHWSVIDVAGASRELLTSDRPIVMPLGLANPKAHIALPISPTKLFVAAYNERFKALPTVSKSRIVRVMNKDVVQQAREFVWGTDHSQEHFIQKNIGLLPDRIVLTDEQREKSLIAARGEIDFD